MHVSVYLITLNINYPITGSTEREREWETLADIATITSCMASLLSKLFGPIWNPWNVAMIRIPWNWHCLLLPLFSTIQTTCHIGQK